MAKIPREILHHPGKTTIPREAIREAVRGAASKEVARPLKLKAIPIPTSLMLGGKTIKVVYDDAVSHREGINGDIHHEMGTIRLQPDRQGRPTPQDDIERVFLHELTHGVLFTIGKMELARDEELVNAFSNVLHQALKTAEYE